MNNLGLYPPTPLQYQRYLQGRRDHGPPLRDLFILLILIVTIVGLATNNALIVGIGGITLTTTILARLWAAVSLRDFDYSIDGQISHAFIDDIVDIEFRYENKKPVPLTWLRTQETIPEGLEVIGNESHFSEYLGGTPIQETVSLRSYERLILRRSFRALRRGHYYFGPVSITSGDPFGIYSNKRAIRRHSWSLFVYPKIVDLNELQFPLARPMGDLNRGGTIWKDLTMPVGLTEYRPGDPVKTIDWKASARRGSLFVKTYQESFSEHVTILLEGLTTDRPWEGLREDVLEALASCAASVTIRASQLSFRVGFVTNSVLSLGGENAIPPSNKPSQTYRILESLSRMKPATHVRLDDLLSGHNKVAFQVDGILIFIAAHLRESTTTYILDMARKGHPLITLWVGREPPPDIADLNIIDYRSVFGIFENDGSKDTGAPNFTYGIRL